MSNVQKVFSWYASCNKRLFHKYSFIILLVLIPIIIPIMKISMEKESGILKIAITAEDSSEASSRAMDYMINSGSIIRFIKCKNPDEATNLVKTHKADAAWIFMAELEKKINKFVSGDSVEAFMKVIEREENVTLQLSREMLYGAVFDEVSYNIFKTNTNNILENKKTYSENELKEIYHKQERGNDIVKLARLSSDKPVELNYLTSPLRGILSVLLILSGLAAVMYFLSDQNKGKFDWLSKHKRIIPAFAICISAIILEGTVILIALILAGFSVGFIRELVSMLLFIISATGFSLLFCILFKSSGKLGAFIPGIILSTLALSPIFFNMEFLKPVQLMLPTHYYLYSLYDNTFYLYILLYIFVLYSVVVCLNFLINKRTG